MAPEVIEFYGARPESDVWSLGCTIIELLRGEPPYFHHDPFSAMYKMVEDDHPPLPSGISLSLNDFLMLCFKKDVNMRCSAKDLLKHSWVKTEIADQQTAVADLTNIIDEIEEYNEELDREMGKFPLHSEEQEHSDLLSKSHTLTTELRDKMKDKQNNKKNNINNKSAKTPQKTTESDGVSITAEELGFESVEDLNWDQEFKLQETSAPLQLKLPSVSVAAESLGFDSVDDINWETTEEPDSTPSVEQEQTKPQPLKLKAPAAWTEEDLDWGDEEDDLSSAVQQQQSLKQQSQTPKTLSAFVEKEEDDFGAEFDTSGGILQNRLENKKGEEWADWDEELAIEEEEPQDEKAILREKAQEALLFEIKELIQVLKPNQEEDKVKRACMKLMDIFNKSPEMKTKLITNHGLLPLITMLDEHNVSSLNSIMRLVTLIIDNTEILVNLCVMGIIPAILKCGDNNHSTLTRLYAAYFVQRVISTAETLQMFIACRGLVLLVAFLETEYHRNRELVHISIDCISSIFKFQGQTTTPKNEYFHLFVNAGLLERLGISLVSLLSAESEEAKNESPDDFENEDDDLNFIEKVAKIFKVFSMGDSDVKLRLCSKDVLSNIKEALKLMKPTSKELLMLLNMIRNISFDRHTLNQLAVVIVPLLEIAMHFVHQNEFLKEVFNQITHSLFHLCRLNRPRQEVAAKSGLIPFLKFVIQNNKPLKEFAVPLMCELAGSSQVTRTILLDNDGLLFYLDQLRDSKGTFQTDALEAIAVCLENEKQRVEEVVLAPQSLNLIKEVFESVKDYQLVTILDSILKIITCSVKINKELGAETKEGGFVSVLKNKLHHPNPLSRVNLLKTLNALCSKYSDPPHFLRQNNLLKVVKFMCSNDSSMLVRNMANVLLKDGGK